jgi:phage terminase small subunit
MTPPNAPQTLSGDAQALWNRLCTEFVIDDSASRTLLETALAALDRANEARAAIDRDGACIRDRFDQIQKHPMLSVERDCRAQFLQGMRLLNLDPGTAPAPRLGRPPGGGKSAGPR